MVQHVRIDLNDYINEITLLLHVGYLRDLSIIVL